MNGRSTSEGESTVGSRGDVALAELRPGDAGTIRAIEAEAPIARRLLALGFVPGSAVTVCRVAPLRDPVEYEVRGTRVSLRRSEACRIRVSREDA